MDTAVYVHVPYCRTKCLYCDFLSFPRGNASLSPQEYLRLLGRELTLRGRELKMAGYRVSTLYIGGGTPTELTAAELLTLLCACRELLPLHEPEWTVEANPATLDEEKLDLLARHGANRISLGVQDLDDRRLALLGRRHTAAEAARAFSLCRERFPSVSVDLMVGLPGQLAGDFMQTLATVVAWGPDHLSLYSLKLEEGTSLFYQVGQGALQLPDEDTVAQMLQKAGDLLAKHGYLHYEIANFARPGHACRHNLTYWRNLPYLGVGLGAHSYWGEKRLINTMDPQVYAQLLSQGAVPVAEAITVTERMAMEDTLILGLRLASGVSLSDFAKRFDREVWDVFGPTILRQQSLGLLVCQDGHLRLTKRGRFLANLVFADFITL